MNVVASVNSEAEFTERVERIVPTLDCILLELDRVQPIDERMEEPDSPEELNTMRSSAQRRPQTSCSERSTSGLRATATDKQSSVSLHSFATFTCCSERVTANSDINPVTASRVRTP